jgi:hypothetical protein
MNISEVKKYTLAEINAFEKEEIVKVKEPENIIDGPEK